MLQLNDELEELMAGDWIKMRTDLSTSPKVVRMASALRADRLRVIGGLHAVWSLFDVHSVDGTLDGYSLDTLDEMISFAGFGAAMCSVQWLEQGADCLVTPRFDEHNGQSAKRRAMEAHRKRDDRNVSALDADKKRTRGEKRREDKEEGYIAGAGAEYPPDFETAWAAYPARPGGNKRDALKAWSARLNTGSSIAEMLAGAQRYKAYVTALKTEPQFIKQPATFFGPARHFDSEWAVTAVVVRKGSHDLSQQDYEAGVGRDGRML